tara:strand:- start:546 stop:1085 length:540 start_codon:yes stop_codon:yes gene_type:complete
MKILDNFLLEDDFQSLYNLLLNDSSFPWYFNNSIAGDLQNLNDFQFCHTFFTTQNTYLDKPLSPFSHYLKPLLSKLSPHFLLRVKANLRPRTERNFLSKYHTDLSDLGNLTAIFYINSNDGYTEFEDGTIVNSIQNRILIFPGNLKHRGASPTDVKSRALLNINYFPGKLLDNSFYLPS